MIFLPIVSRELRVAARQHGTHSIRLWMALGAMGLGIFFFIANPGTSAAELARRIFTGVAGLAMAYCLASGRLLTADCISSEKREGTLGLLFLTDLKGYDVVCGKLAATSFRALYGLVAILPVLAVPLLLGGLTNGEIWRMLLVLVDAYFLSLAVGVFASAICTEARRAMGANFLILLLLAGLPAACAGAIFWFTSPHVMISELFYSCPVYSFVLSSATDYARKPDQFWWSIGVIHALSWILVISAGHLALRAWQDRPAGPGKRPWRERWRVWVYGNPARRLALRKRLLNVNAFYWLASRAWFKPAGVWIVLCLLTCWWLYILLQLQFSWHEESFIMVTFILVNSLLKLWIPVETAQRLAEDQKIGALELLLSTPLTVPDIVRGQLLALRRQFLGPLIVVLAAETALTLAGSTHQSRDLNIFALGIAFMVMLLVDSLALIWVAMAAALTARSPNHASLSTISRVLLLPLVLYAAGSILAGAWTTLRGATGPGWKFYLYFWFCLGILADLFFGLPAWWRLQTRFRQLALRRFTATPRAHE